MSLALTIIICLIASFILSGLESALLSISRVRLHHQVKEGNLRAQRLEKILQRRQQLLIAILIFNTTTNLAAFALLTHLTVDTFGNWGYLIAFLLSLPVYLIWIELLPKSIFKNLSYDTLLRFLPILSVIDGITRPIIFIPQALLRLATSKSRADDENSANSARDEFRMLTEILERDGVFRPGEKTMIHQVLDFQKLPISEVMLPLSRVTAVPLEMPIASVLNLARETNFSQFPVISPQGDLIGLVDILELLSANTSEGVVRNYLRKLVHAAPHDRAIDVLRRLRRSGLRVAAIHNEKGRPLGIVSVDDMIPHLLELPSPIHTG